MVGRALVRHCVALGDEVFAHDHRSLDISQAENVLKTVVASHPDAVINCAAWTDVDGCELDHDRAYAANAAGPENLATASAAIGATFVTVSTDYVFDGTKEGFYTQSDTPNPISVYGRSKLDGEVRAMNAHSGGTSVVRTGFVFGVGGTNFLSTIVDRARRGERLKAISDSWGTPTHGWDLARRLRELAELRHPGIFHVVNAGAGVTYEEFARAALDISGLGATPIESVEMNSLSRPAPRPRNSRLKCLLSEKLGLAELPFWKDSLKEFLALDPSLSANTGAVAKG